jgi:hypothetical protein
VMVFSPAINARNDMIFLNPISENNVSITVIEYRSDGTIGKSIVKMSQENVDKCQADLAGIKDLDARLSVYKKYNLIPQDVTVKKLQEGMNEKTQKIDSAQHKLNNNLFGNEFYSNYNCNISGWSDSCVGDSIIIHFGTSLITYILNSEIREGGLKSYDVLDFIIGHYIDFRTNGGSSPVFFGRVNGIIKIVGFVGYMFHWHTRIWSLVKGFDGFAYYVQAKGDFF